MKIVLATGNKGKIKEFKHMLPHDEVIAYSDVIDEFEIVEDGSTFQENALIKAQAINKKLSNTIEVPYIIISDDSGITVPLLNNEPGIYSARYAGVLASDKDNLNKLIDRLKENKLSKTNAYYTACIAIIYKNEEYTVHGWMHGDIIDHELGEGGFGYDPIFMPSGYNQTLGQMDPEIKKEISHRGKALSLAKKVMDILI